MVRLSPEDQLIRDRLSAHLRRAVSVEDLFAFSRAYGADPNGLVKLMRELVTEVERHRREQVP